MLTNILFQATSDITAPFMHPSEVQMLGKIVEVMRNFRKIEDFIRSVRSSSMAVELGKGQTSVFSGIHSMFLPSTSRSKIGPVPPSICQWAGRKPRRVPQDDRGHGEAIPAKPTQSHVNGVRDRLPFQSPLGVSAEDGPGNHFPEVC